MHLLTEVYSYVDGRPKRILTDGEWLEAAFGSWRRKARPGILTAPWLQRAQRPAARQAGRTCGGS